MLDSDLEIMKKAAFNKADICNNHLGKYFIRAIVAGFFIVVATMLSNVTAAVLLKTYPQFGKLISSIFFSIAIILVVFIGGELFTGNNMVMAMGVYTKTCKVSDMIKTWVISYIGNFVGSFILGLDFLYGVMPHIRFLLIITEVLYIQNLMRHRWNCLYVAFCVIFLYVLLSIQV